MNKEIYIAERTQQKQDTGYNITTDISNIHPNMESNAYADNRTPLAA